MRLINYSIDNSLMINSTNTCIVSIGSNVEAAKNVTKAQEALEQLFKPVQFSCAGLTVPIGLKNKNLFLNQVAIFSTQMDSESIISVLKKVETDLGRVKGDKENIVIDLDLVCYNDHILKVKDYERDYFQVGLTEIKSKGK